MTIPYEGLKPQGNGREKTHETPFTMLTCPAAPIPIYVYKSNLLKYLIKWFYIYLYNHISIFITKSLSICTSVNYFVTHFVIYNNWLISKRV